MPLSPRTPMNRIKIHVQPLKADKISPAGLKLCSVSQGKYSKKGRRGDNSRNMILSCSMCHLTIARGPLIHRGVHCERRTTLPLVAGNVSMCVCVRQRVCVRARVREGDRPINSILSRSLSRQKNEMDRFLQKSHQWQ